MMTRHEFLAELHRSLHPKHYLEIGVQTGTSLLLATCPAIGIDPAPAIPTPVPANITLYQMSSQRYFEEHGPTTPLEDLVFIDGDHHFEEVLRDLMNVERYSSHEDTLVVLDDVLPYNRGMAAREPCQGDWSGDAWKLWPILLEYRPFLELRLVDVAPAGLLLIRGLRKLGITLKLFYDNIVNTWMDQEIPDSVLKRFAANDPQTALEWAKIK
jgi:hypothetical protein